jgi:4a-hydroxytetrahydrobiopterin dehydratase
VTPAVVPLDEAARRLRALAGGGLGPGLPRRRRDQWIMLQACAATLPTSPLDERSLNEMLKAWLGGLGPNVRLDHVSLRRALVDDGFVERSADGARYLRSRAHERQVLFVSPSLEGVMTLSQEKCVACHADAPKATAEEIAEWMPQVAAWRIDEVDNVPRLVRTFAFPDFAGALAFANRVGALAEAEGHHPALLVEWGKVTVSWWTHKIRGLHRNDFVMAAKTDSLAIV